MRAVCDNKTALEWDKGLIAKTNTNKKKFAIVKEQQ